MQRVSPMQRVERTENRRDLASHEALGLRAFAAEPRAEVAGFSVLQGQAVARLVTIDFDEAIEDAQRAWLVPKELGEVRLAKPPRDAVADLDAHLRREPGRGRRCREVDLAETALADESIETIGATGFRAVRTRYGRLPFPGATIGNRIVLRSPSGG